jgi:hypothetical protein
MQFVTGQAHAWIPVKLSGGSGGVNVWLPVLWLVDVVEFAGVHVTSCWGVVHVMKKSG